MASSESNLNSSRRRLFYNPFYRRHSAVSTAGSLAGSPACSSTHLPLSSSPSTDDPYELDEQDCEQGLAPELLKEYTHAYLSRGAAKGTIYVTSERLIFIPRAPRKESLLNVLPQATSQLEYSVHIVDIDTMKVVQSSRGQWFFVCYENLFVCTMPFKSRNRAWSFLKLVANIRFEQMVRKHLPPRYTRLSSGAQNQGAEVDDNESAPHGTRAAATTTSRSRSTFLESHGQPLSDAALHPGITTTGDSDDDDDHDLYMAPNPTLSSANNDSDSDNIASVHDAGSGTSTRLNLNPAEAIASAENSNDSQHAEDSLEDFSPCLADCRGLASQQRQANALCRLCTRDDCADWGREDARLPTYAESEYAVGMYLVELDLIPDPAVFDRTEASIDPPALLARACAPPLLDFLEGRQVANPVDYSAALRGPGAGSTANATPLTPTTTTTAAGTAAATVYDSPALAPTQSSGQNSPFSGPLSSGHRAQIVFLPSGAIQRSVSNNSASAFESPTLSPHARYHHHPSAMSLDDPLSTAVPPLSAHLSRGPSSYSDATPATASAAAPLALSHSQPAAHHARSHSYAHHAVPYSQILRILNEPHAINAFRSRTRGHAHSYSYSYGMSSSPYGVSVYARHNSSPEPSSPAPSSAASPGPGSDMSW